MVAETASRVLTGRQNDGLEAEVAETASRVQTGMQDDGMEAEVVRVGVLGSSMKFSDRPTP